MSSTPSTWTAGIAALATSFSQSPGSDQHACQPARTPSGLRSAGQPAAFSSETGAMELAVRREQWIGPSGQSTQRFPAAVSRSSTTSSWSVLASTPQPASEVEVARRAEPVHRSSR
jgi:hypothetical protein